MAARSPSREKRGLCQFSTALSSAFTEWLLILLLFVDAFCLYLVSKLFRCSKLQSPCLVCSRFTNLLGNEKLRFYNDLVCDVHKLEISTFAFCHVHKKLADAGEMCETCLLSLEKKKSSWETCKFLLSKLSIDLDDGDQILNTRSDEMVKVPLLENDQEVCSPHKKPCSCCSQQCNIEPSAYRLFEDKPIFKEFAHSGIQLSSARLNSRAHLLDIWSKDREIPSMQLTTNQPGDYGFDCSSHFGYKELKFTSDSESEVPYLGDDDDDGSSNARGTEDVKEESVAQNLKSSTYITGALKDLSVVSDNIVLGKLIHPDPVISDASSISKSQLHEGGSCDKSFVESNDGLGHGLEEINWINVEVIPSSPLSSQIISELVPTEISNVEEVAEVDVSGTSSTPKVEITRSLNLTDISYKLDKVTSESDDNLPSGAKGAQRTPTSSEITLARESARIQEELKQCLFQLPAAWCLESSWTDFNLSAGKDDECKLSDISSCNGLHIVTKRPDAELSCLESADGSFVSEVEGEGAVDCLTKQIEMDHNFLSNLYKELEEERNASAIAANQAMAMINKLQEEKAAMQLEVMQYLRMMEEQTEYEQEALQKLNDQLTEREKEIQVLEAELESYRKRCWDESFTGMIVQPSYDSEESEYSTTSTPHVLKSRGSDKNHLTGITFQDFAWAASDSIKETVLNFEDEREYLSECLKRLEKNVRLFSSADASRHDEEDDEFNDDIYADDTKRENHQNQCLHEDKRYGLCSLNTIEENCPTQEFNRMEERISSVKLLPTPVESLSLEEWESAIKENEKDNRLNSSISNNKHPKTGKRNDVIALGDEVEHLHARLEALEADRDFLEHTINSLRNGKDGLHFVQEIATHLREIRKIGATQREQVLA